MADEAAAPEEAAAGPAEGGAAGSPAKHKRSALAPRIKRLMQRDDEVGKISQYTPLALAKAMELFLQTLATKAVAVAQQRKAKTLTASHLKACIVGDTMLDFLKETVAKAADLPPAAEGDGSDSDGGAPAKPKRVRKPRAPRKPKAAAEEGDSDDDAGDAPPPAAKRPRRKAAAAKPTMDDSDADDEPAAAPAPAPAPVPPADAAPEVPAFEVPAGFTAPAADTAAAEDDYDAE